MDRRWLIYNNLTINLELFLNESETRALDALAGYDIEKFLKVFYQEMGKHYLQPHEKGLRELFARINKECRPVISVIDEARDALRNRLERDER